MVVVVLTGGIGSGKGVAAEYFGRRGASVIDLDDVARGLMAPNSPILASVAQEFGSGMLLSDGSLDRAVLAKACFSDRASARRLDEMVHPAVAQEAASMLEHLRQHPAPPAVVVIEVPLLVEAPDFALLADLVVAIAAAENLRIDRAVARGMARDDVERRALVQAPDSSRAALADVVIENNGTLEEYFEALGRFWDEHLGAGVQGG